MSQLISDKFTAWQAECEARFQQLKANEEELNRIFIDIYGLQGGADPGCGRQGCDRPPGVRQQRRCARVLKGSNYVRSSRWRLCPSFPYAVV